MDALSGPAGRRSPARPGSRLPQSLLFACSENAVRSPMAEALAQRLLGRSVYVASAGARSGHQNPFTLAALAEVGIDWSRHWPKTFGDLGDDGFDQIITLSPEAHHRALDYTRSLSVEVTYWPTIDPTAVEGSRDAVLGAFRMVRDGLAVRIGRRFGLGAAGSA